MRTCFLILGFLCCVGSALADAPKTLRVVTWNLQWFPGGKPGATKDAQAHHVEVVREGIRKLDPDILLLQEVGSEAALGCRAGLRSLAG
jgi:endonuclease/exonuclease/phosphatase family metal-dependent hydrolase